MFISFLFYDVRMVREIPDFSLEIASGANLVAGVDEAGRCPLCGPVIAAAVILFVQNARYGSGIVGASVCLFLGLSGLSGVILFAVRLFS